MQTCYMLALHFSLPLNALVTKGHPNPMTDLSTAVLTDHFAVSHSKFQKAFWKPCVCICLCVAVLPLHPFIHLPECIFSIISAFINLAVHSATLILITVFELLSHSWSRGQGTHSQTETLSSSSPVAN